MTLYTNALFGLFGKDTGMCLFKQAIGLQPDHGSCETLVLADRLGVLIEIGSTRPPGQILLRLNVSGAGSRGLYSIVERSKP